MEGCPIVRWSAFEHCRVLELVEMISEVTRTPFLLLDSEANTVFRSSYYFNVGLGSDAADYFRSTLTKLCGQAPEEGGFFEVFPGLEALLVPLTFENRRMYLMIGYFVDPLRKNELAAVLDAQTAGEIAAKDLSVRWGERRELLRLLAVKVVSLFDVFPCREKLEKFGQVLAALEAEHRRAPDEDTWGRVFQGIYGLYAGDVVAWLCLSFVKGEGKRGFCSKHLGDIQPLKSTPMALNRWVLETGQAVYLTDPGNDPRAAEVLATLPHVTKLVSLPLGAGGEVWGVLHIGLRKEICRHELQMLEAISVIIGNFARKEGAGEEHFSSALDIIINLLNAEVDEHVYSLVLETLFRALGCRSISLYARQEQALVPLASHGASEAQLMRECIHLNNLAKRDDCLLPVFPLLPGPQGAGCNIIPIFIGESLEGFLVICLESPIAFREKQLVQQVAELLGISFRQRQLRKQAHELQKDLVSGLLLMLEAHLPWLKQHGEDTAGYALALGRELELPDNELESLYAAALLHNLGKIRVPPSLLTETRKLTLPEKRKIERAGKYGAELLAKIPTLAHLAPVLEQLEENLDGSGYPLGLKEKEIHPHTKIIRIASVFAAMASERSYRPSLDCHEALARMEKDVGIKYAARHFNVFKCMMLRKAKRRQGATCPSELLLEKLTPRELEVLQMIARGKTNAQIAKELFISEKTVKIHVSNILSKLELKDRTQAAIFFLTREKKAYGK